MKFKQDFINVTNFIICSDGERGGSVLECRALEREVGGLETYLRRVVSLSKTLYSLKELVIPRKQWLRPNMTENFLTGMLNLNTNKQLFVLTSATMCYHICIVRIG